MDWIHIYELAFLQMPNRRVSDVTTDHKLLIAHRTLLLHLANLFNSLHIKRPSEHPCNMYILTTFPSDKVILQNIFQTRYFWQSWVIFHNFLSLKYLCPNCVTIKSQVTWYDMTRLKIFSKNFLSKEFSLSHFKMQFYCSSTFDRRVILDEFLS